jgi:hypothetical protein
MKGPSGKAFLTVRLGPSRSRCARLEDVIEQPADTQPGMLGFRAALRLILGFSIVSTAAHYTHNFVAVEDYPGGGLGVQIAIVMSWPVLTAIGLYGYRLYTEGRFREAHICLLLYAPLGLLTPAHFLYGAPDIPAFFYGTIFTDGLAGLAVVGFVAWSARWFRGEEQKSGRGGALAGSG